MVRDPETAYIVSNEVFDKELEDLGWSPKDLLTMAGMYMEREMYKFRKVCVMVFKLHWNFFFKRQL